MKAINVYRYGKKLDACSKIIRIGQTFIQGGNIAIHAQKFFDYKNEITRGSFVFLCLKTKNFCLELTIIFIILLISILGAC